MNEQVEDAVIVEKNTDYIAYIEYDSVITSQVEKADAILVIVRTESIHPLLLNVIVNAKSRDLIYLNGQAFKENIKLFGNPEAIMALAQTAADSEHAQSAFSIELENNNG